MTIRSLTSQSGQAHRSPVAQVCRSGRGRARAPFLAGLCSAGVWLGLGCSSGDEADPDLSEPGTAGNAVLPGAPGAGPGTAAGGAAADAPGVANYDRPLGMPIGQGASGPGSAPGAAPEAAPSAATPEGPAEVNEDLEIPIFAPPEAAPPCSGCVELKVDVDDINQRDNFVFAPGSVTVTRVVWTIVVPFNSDQLFVQPFVDNAYGTFTDLDANAFAIGTPVQLVHEYSGAAGTVGLAVGSSGAWTGNMTMSVFVDSVTLEGADAAASRSFDADLGGLVVGSNGNNPQIVHHPLDPQ